MLTAAEKDALRRWVEQGAPWGRHWAYETPERPAVPEISSPGSQIRNPIDAFVLARLRAEGLNAVSGGLAGNVDPPRHVRPDRLAAHAP